MKKHVSKVVKRETRFKEQTATRKSVTYQQKRNNVCVVRHIRTVWRFIYTKHIIHLQGVMLIHVIEELQTCVRGYTKTTAKTTLYIISKHTYPVLHCIFINASIGEYTLEPNTSIG
jgi:hypothetical protein